MGKAERTRQARQKLERVRAQQRAQARRRKAIVGTAGGVAVAAVVAVIAFVAVSGGGGGGHEVMPAGVADGTPVVQPAALTVPNPTGIKGVVAYDTTGWPASSSNGPASRALARVSPVS